MAYVLGFFCADGCMFMNPRGSYYVAFYSTDKSILEKIKNVMGSDHIIGSRIRESIKPAYSLQIGSKKMFKDLKRFGLTPNKSMGIELPIIPKKYFPDFVRGYFDGDGNVTISSYYRRNRKSHRGRTMLSGFISGSLKFLTELRSALCRYADMGKGTLYFSNRGHRLYYSVSDSRKLYDFMYNDEAPGLFLERKRNKFLEYPILRV